MESPVVFLPNVFHRDQYKFGCFFIDPKQTETWSSVTEFRGGHLMFGPEATCSYFLYDIIYYTI